MNHVYQIRQIVIGQNFLNALMDDVIVQVHFIMMEIDAVHIFYNYLSKIIKN